jgi:hypothetical protein
VRPDFQGAAECFRVAIQAALTTNSPTTSSAQANSKPEEDLAIPVNEAQAVTSGSLTNARLPSSAPAWMTNRKACSSSFCKITETYSHGSLRICWESRENWPSTN